MSKLRLIKSEQTQGPLLAFISTNPMIKFKVTLSLRIVEHFIFFRDLFLMKGDSTKLDQIIFLFTFCLSLVILGIVRLG